MRICCFGFSCFGEEEEERDSVIACSLCYFCRRNKEGNCLLGNAIEDMDNNDSELGFWANFDNDGGSGGNGSGLRLDGERANEKETTELFDLDGESNEKSEGSLPWLNEVKTRRADGASGSQELKVDVNLNLGLGGDPSSSSTIIATGRDSSDRDLQNKRPKVHSFSLDWGTQFLNEFHYLHPHHDKFDDGDFPDSTISGVDATNNIDADRMDDMEVRMDLTDDLLHMVFSFLEHIDLCRAARVCRQWRDASSHEDFWRYLNFENRYISVQQCQ